MKLAFQHDDQPIFIFDDAVVSGSAVRLEVEFREATRSYLLRLGR